MSSGLGISVPRDHSPSLLRLSSSGPFCWGLEPPRTNLSSRSSRWTFIDVPMRRTLISPVLISLSKVRGDNYDSWLRLCAKTEVDIPASWPPGGEGFRCNDGILTKFGPEVKI